LRLARCLLVFFRRVPRLCTKVDSDVARGTGNRADRKTSSQQHNLVVRLLGVIGRSVMAFVDDLGAISHLLRFSLKGIFCTKQLLEMGWQTLYVSVSRRASWCWSVFLPEWSWVSSFYTLIQFGSVSALGTAISLSLVAKLEPGAHGESWWPHERAQAWRRRSGSYAFRRQNRRPRHNGRRPRPIIS